MRQNPPYLPPEPTAPLKEHSMAPWKRKAHKIIGELCATSYRQSNPIGQKRHRPYSVPMLAEELIECLNADDEHRAKALFMLSHDIPELLTD